MVKEDLGEKFLDSDSGLINVAMIQSRTLAAIMFWTILGFGGEICNSNTVQPMIECMYHHDQPAARGKVNACPLTELNIWHGLVGKYHIKDVCLL